MSDDKIEIVDSRCCQCFTKIVAQIVPDHMELTLRNIEKKGEGNSYKAIEWCPNCKEIHVMETVPNPETRRVAKPTVIERGDWKDSLNCETCCHKETSHSVMPCFTCGRRKFDYYEPEEDST